MSTYKNPFEDRKQYHEHAEWIEEHLNSFFDDAQIAVFHEIPTLDLHLDVFFVKPTNLSFNLLITSGMSTLQMNAPEELDFAELMILLPKHIDFEKVYTGQKKNDWIITILKQTAKFPHFHDTWIGIGHTIQANTDLTPYSDQTEYAGVLILPSVTFGKEFTEIYKNDTKINIYSIFPLYENEIEFKIENGYHKLLDLIIKADTKEVLDTHRKNLISKKSIWRKFFK